MSLKYEPASEPLHISVKWWFSDLPFVDGPAEWVALQELLYKIQKHAFALDNNDGLKLQGYLAHCKTAPSSAVGLCLWGGGPREGGVFYERGILYFAHFTKVLSWLYNHSYSFFFFTLKPRFKWNHSASTGPPASPDAAPSGPLSASASVDGLESS